eukprot:10941749-Lingulodinium_polyedra.AAC.1
MTSRETWPRNYPQPSGVCSKGRPPTIWPTITATVDLDDCQRGQEAPRRPNRVARTTDEATP